MKFNRNTRISTLIKDNKETIQAIASINKNFLKLKNPVLRRVLAPRVTVADAAKVGRVEMEVLIKKLEDIGFQYEGSKPKKDEVGFEKPNQKNSSNEIKNLVSLDVRPTLDSGKDPFDIIMKKVKVLKDNETLKIINTFEPIPLIRKLKSKGYESWTERLEEGIVLTFFKKNNTKWVDDELEKKVNKSSKDFDEQLEFFGNNIRTIDVRDMEMPEPMVSILKEIETLKKGEALFVDHKKIPQFLLPELEQRGYDILYKEIDCNNVQLLIFK